MRNKSQTFRFSIFPDTSNNQFNNNVLYSSARSSRYFSILSSLLFLYISTPPLQAAKQLIHMPKLT